MRNLSIESLEVFEKVGLFTSDIFVGAYRVYAYVGIYGATLALIIWVAMMIWEKKLSKVLLGLFVLNLILAIYLYLRFSY